MIRLDTLRNKINLIFFIAYIFLVSIFLFLYKGNQETSQEMFKMQERANMHYLYLYYLKYGKIDEDYLKSQNICVADQSIAKVKLTKEFKDKNGTRRFGVIDLNLKRYIVISNDRFNIILENRNKPKTPARLITGFVAATILMLVLYFWIIRSIKPLALLKSKIMHFSEGNLDIECKSTKKDEIADVANAFDYAAQKIRELIHSRQLLLRAIMHELKTPIGKGRLLSEMVKDDKQKDRFHAIFERLNLLIDEFAKVEQVASKSFSAVFKPYKVSDIIEASVDMLMLENSSQYVNVVISKDFVITVDFELMSLAIKNLLDNGIKYSSDKEVHVIVANNQIVIANHAQKLPNPIESYYEPFHASKSGLGLGLYIVKSIMDINKMDMEYQYRDEQNRFILRQDTKKLASAEQDQPVRIPA